VPRQRPDGRLLHAACAIAIVQRTTLAVEAKVSMKDHRNSISRWSVALRSFERAGAKLPESIFCSEADTALGLSRAAVCAIKVPRLREVRPLPACTSPCPR